MLNIASRDPQIKETERIPDDFRNFSKVADESPGRIAGYICLGRSPTLGADPTSDRGIARELAGKRKS
jgi:hypothetical protein